MEQQKVLWIIFSVTLFLVVVVVVGFVWFLPPESDGEAESGQVIAGAEPSTVFDPIIWVREDEEVPGMSEEAVDDADADILLVYGETEEAEDEDAAAPETATAPEEESTVTVVEMPQPVSTPPQTTTAPAPRAAPPATKTVAPEPRTVRVTQYWIQAGSFTSQSRAEETQTMLAEKGWNTRVISRDVNGQIFFRVRLGPFETKSEANKFLDWITDIESFESSYISQVYTTRTIN